MTASSRSLQRILFWHRPLVLLVAAMTLLVLVALVGLAVDDRVVAGVPIWLKPLKFALSLALYGLTLAWMLSLLWRGSRWGARMGTVVAVAGAIEMVIIVGQVLRGRQSHFNGQTTFDTALFFVMAATITVLWVANLVIAVLLLREIGWRTGRPRGRSGWAWSWRRPGWPSGSSWSGRRPSSVRPGR